MLALGNTDWRCPYTVDEKTYIFRMFQKEGSIGALEALELVPLKPWRLVPTRPYCNAHSLLYNLKYNKT